MSEFQERYGLQDGESLLTLGPPGTGKSHLLGSVCAVVPPERVALLCTKPREKTSALYRKYGLTERAGVFSDLACWNPEHGKYEAKAWRKLFDQVCKLFDDDKYDAVLLDPWTDAVTLLEHHILASHKVSSPGDLSDTRGFYRQLKDKEEDFIQRLNALTDSTIVKSPKFVLVSCHTQPPKEAVQLARGVSKESADQLAEGVEYEGKVLPQMEGSYRRKIAGDFGWVMYAEVQSGNRMDPKSKKMEKYTDFMVQVRCSPERHAKMASIAAENMPEYLPNNFSELYKWLKEGAK